MRACVWVCERVCECEREGERTCVWRLFRFVCLLLCKYLGDCFSSVVCVFSLSPC